MIKSKAPIVFDKSFLKRYTLRLTHLANSTPSEHDPLSLTISVTEMLIAFPETYSTFTRFTSQFQQTLRDTLVQSVFKQKTPEDKIIARTRVYLIFKTFPYNTVIYKRLGCLASSDLGSWIIFEGTVVRTTQRKTLEVSKFFKCTDCAQKYRLFTTYHNGYRFEHPPQCTNKVIKQKQDNMISKLFQRLDHRRHSKSKGKKQSKNSKEQDQEEPERVSKEKPQRLVQCGCKRFEPTEEGRIFQNYQELVIQEPFKHISPGRIPQTICALLQGLFIDEFRPGDNVSVSGLLSQRYDKLARDCRLQSQVVVVVNNIFAVKHTSNHSYNKMETQSTMSQSQSHRSQGEIPRDIKTQNDKSYAQLKLRAKILEVFCPDLYCKELYKLGTLLCLLGGVPSVSQGTKLRGQSHLLLVGEPGTGKSVLLKAAAELSERSFFTNAIGSSSAGLTVSYVKQGGSWAIEAGALVLADNGVCCIDQLNLMNKKDYPSVLEAMEQQTISSAKAGVIGKMNCRTTVIAACNPLRPGQKYDDGLDLTQNTGLSLPLITRFDLIMILKDESTVEEDDKKSMQILEGFMHQDEVLFSRVQQQKDKDQFPLKNYFKKCQEYAPEIHQTQFLTNYFIGLRQLTLEKKGDVKTVRALESLCRLCQAHAKLMHRDYTTMLDCVSVVMLSEGVYFQKMQDYLRIQSQLQAKLGQ